MMLRRPRLSQRDADGWVLAISGLQALAAAVREVVERVADAPSQPVPPATDVSRTLVHALLGVVVLSRELDRVVKRWTHANEADRAIEVAPVDDLLR